MNNNYYNGLAPPLTDYSVSAYTLCTQEMDPVNWTHSDAI